MLMPSAQNLRYPSLQFEHLVRLSDSTGILQHARWSVPDPRWGYTLDDNARAFVVALHGYQHTSDGELREWARRYLAFMIYAQTDDGWFRNFADYNRRWLESAGSPDSNGRAMWALGYGVHHAPDDGMRETAMWVFSRAWPNISRLTSPRAVASALLGCAEAHEADWKAPTMLAQIDDCATYLTKLFDQASQPDWQWFEHSLTYGNATLPHAMIVAGRVLGSERYLDIGRRTLNFLCDIVFEQSYLDVIGHDGWFERGGAKTPFDQQPIDAACLVDALLVAQRVFQDPQYGTLARKALGWFYGQNRMGIALYDARTGGCFDALIAEGVNRNQGAESTLAHLSARLAIEMAEPEMKYVLERVPHLHQH